MSLNNDDAEAPRGFAPTNGQKGAFLIALGQQMRERELSAGAALDGNGHANITYSMMSHGVDGEDVQKILDLNHDALTEAIDDSF